jgi:hypothetical protein
MLVRRKIGAVMEEIELPPLPHTTLMLSDCEGGSPFGEGYDEDEMRAYARAAVLKERERAGSLIVRGAVIDGGRLGAVIAIEAAQHVFESCDLINVSIVFSGEFQKPVFVKCHFKRCYFVTWTPSGKIEGFPPGAIAESLVEGPNDAIRKG